MVKAITNSLSTKYIIIYSLLAIALGLGILAVVLHFINGSGYIGPAGPKGEQGNPGKQGEQGKQGNPGTGLTQQQQADINEMLSLKPSIIDQQADINQMLSLKPFLVDTSDQRNLQTASQNLPLVTFSMTDVKINKGIIVLYTKSDKSEYIKMNYSKANPQVLNLIYITPGIRTGPSTGTQLSFNVNTNTDILINMDETGVNFSNNNPINIAWNVIYTGV